MVNVVDEQVERIKQQVGDGRAICALSGGVDSAVAAALVQRAIGDRLTCVYVDHGMMRKGETAQVRRDFEEVFDALDVVDAEDQFLTALARSEEHTSELQSLMRISYAVFCLKKKTKIKALTHSA